MLTIAVGLAPFYGPSDPSRHGSGPQHGVDCAHQRRCGNHRCIPVFPVRAVHRLYVGHHSGNKVRAPHLSIVRDKMFCAHSADDIVVFGTISRRAPSSFQWITIEF